MGVSNSIRSCKQKDKTFKLSLTLHKIDSNMCHIYFFALCLVIVQSMGQVASQCTVNEDCQKDSQHYCEDEKCVPAPTKIDLKTDGEECGNTMNNYIAGKCVLGFVCDAVIYSGKCRKACTENQDCSDGHSCKATKYGKRACLPPKVPRTPRPTPKCIKSRPRCCSFRPMCRNYLCMRPLCQEGNNSETLKQEGESCGSSRSKICGNCAEGLDCNAPMDMCGQCVQK